MDRALREFRIRGVKTNIPFLENVIANETFRSGQATTDADRHHARAVQVQAAARPRDEAADFPRRRDRQRQPARQGLPARRDPCRRPASRRSTARPAPRRARASCCSNSGPKKFAEWIAKQKRLLITDTTLRDAHQSLMATRVRSYRHAARAPTRVARRTPNSFQLEMWGGATFDTAMRFLNEDPVGAPAPSCARRCRTSVSRCCSAAPTPSATRTIPTTSSPDS